MVRRFTGANPRHVFEVGHKNPTVAHVVRARPSEFGYTPPARNRCRRVDLRGLKGTTTLSLDCETACAVSAGSTLPDYVAKTKQELFLGSLACVLVVCQLQCQLPRWHTTLARATGEPMCSLCHWHTTRFAHQF